MCIRPKTQNKMRRSLVADVLFSFLGTPDICLHPRLRLASLCLLLLCITVTDDHPIYLPSSPCTITHATHHSLGHRTLLGTLSFFHGVHYIYSIGMRIFSFPSPFWAPRTLFFAYWVSCVHYCLLFRLHAYLSRARSLLLPLFLLTHRGRAITFFHPFSAF